MKAEATTCIRKNEKPGLAGSGFPKVEELINGVKPPFE